MLSAEAEKALENGLRILARMIARAYRQELAERKITASLISISVEEKHANQRNQRSHQVTPVGQDQVGTQEGCGRNELSGTDGLLYLSRRGKKGLRRNTPSPQDHVSD
jgi:hypothetical protein